VTDLTLQSYVGRDVHVNEVVAALDALPPGDKAGLVGHSYAGLLVRQAADLRPERVAHIVLVDGWAGGDGASMAILAPEWLSAAFAPRRPAREVEHPRPRPSCVRNHRSRRCALALATAAATCATDVRGADRQSGAVEAIAGTGIYCRAQILPFAQSPRTSAIGSSRSTARTR
jgi:pimeloyl-ACP methyl ester carboxylesterase